MLANRVTLLFLLLLPGCDRSSVLNSLSSGAAKSDSTLSLSEVSPNAGLAGSKVLIKGTRLSGAIFSIENTILDTQESSGQIIISIPSGTPGIVEIQAKDNSTTVTHPFYRLSSSSDYPVYNSEPSNVCSSVKYYNLSGALQTGTKNCTTNESIQSCSGYDVPTWSSTISSWLCFSIGTLLANSESRSQFLLSLGKKVEFIAPTLSQSRTVISCANSVNAGDSIYSVEDRSFYYCQNNTWTSLSLINTSVGSTGSTGAQGLTGATGSTGSTGSTGPAGAFIVKDASNNNIGTLISFSDPLDSSILGSATVFNSASSTAFGLRTNGSVATAPSPAIEVFQGANCPGAETPAVIWGGSTPLVSPSMAFAYKLGTNIYNYPALGATASSAALLSYRIDAGTCINAAPGTPINTATADGGPYVFSSYLMAVDPTTERIFIALTDSNATDIKIATCLPSTSNASCTSGGWTSNVTNVPFGSLVAGPDGRLFATGPNTSTAGVAFSMCLPDIANAYCTSASAWTGVTSAGNNGSLDNSSGSNTSSSIAVDPSGRLYVTYAFDNNSSFIGIATCFPTSSNTYCTDNSTSWAYGTSLGGVIFSSILKTDSTGRLHSVYKIDPTAMTRYSTCQPTAANAHCTSASDWSTPIDLSGVIYYNMTVSPAAKVLFTYYDGNNNYAVNNWICSATNGGCGAGISAWTSGSVEGTNGSGGSGHTPGIDAYGNNFVVTTTDYKYCLAASNCALDTNWVTVPVSGSGYSSLITRGNTVYMVHYNGTLDFAAVDSRPLQPAYSTTVNSNIATSYSVPLSFVAP